MPFSNSRDKTYESCPYVHFMRLVKSTPKMDYEYV